MIAWCFWVIAASGRASPHSGLDSGDSRTTVSHSPPCNREFMITDYGQNNTFSSIKPKWAVLTNRTRPLGFPSANALRERLPIQQHERHSKSSTLLPLARKLSGSSLNRLLQYRGPDQRKPHSKVCFARF